MMRFIFVAIVAIAACSKRSGEPKPRWLHLPDDQTWGHGCGPLDKHTNQGGMSTWTTRVDSPTRIPISCTLSWTDSNHTALIGFAVSSYGKNADRRPVDVTRFRKAVAYALDDLIPKAIHPHIIGLLDGVERNQELEANIAGFDVTVARSEATGSARDEFLDELSIYWSPWHATHSLQ